MQYTDMGTDVAQIIETITLIQGRAIVKVIARENATVETLIRRNASYAPKLGSPPLNHMQRAVMRFRQSRRVEALAASCAALDYSVFGVEDVQEDTLATHNIDPRAWKACAVRSLLTANNLPTTCDVFTWQRQVAKILDDELGRLGLDPGLNFCGGKIKPKKNGGWDLPCAGLRARTGCDGRLLSEMCPSRQCTQSKGKRMTSRSLSALTGPLLHTANPQSGGRRINQIKRRRASRMSQ